MNSAVKAFFTRGLRAVLMAFFLFIARAFLTWPWLAFMIAVFLIYACICFAYAGFLAWTQRL
ncbi:hypothetical protein [Lacticaseibacillus chiayiensis]|uniref:hypothetical protein n=1 Tax=Lacticaseibacillus chiayiensis TaxID=2100821 RepID=UPI0010127CC1|nr:hypothetical protein [Lacticaseibacillus chiayiensis]RXT55675.1 hypothetical protein CHT97_12190 [Lacticaseibacillus chiayiensis]